MTDQPTLAFAETANLSLAPATLLGVLCVTIYWRRVRGSNPSALTLPASQAGAATGRSTLSARNKRGAALTHGPYVRRPPRTQDSRPNTLGSRLRPDAAFRASSARWDGGKWFYIAHPQICKQGISTPNAQGERLPAAPAGGSSLDRMDGLCLSARYCCRTAKKPNRPENATAEINVSQKECDDRYASKPNRTI